MYDTKPVQQNRTKQIQKYNLWTNQNKLHARLFLWSFLVRLFQGGEPDFMQLMVVLLASRA